jgi:hypothetical protein
MKKVVLQTGVVALALTAFCLAALAAGPQDDKKPDLSGTWKLDTAKSDFGMMPPPDSQTNVIEHKDPKLKVKTTTKGGMREGESESNYTTDGEESSNKMGEMDVKTTAKWDGKKLVMHSKLDMQGNEVLIDQTYSLSDDAKVLTVDVGFKSPMGDGTQKMIFNKTE